VAYNSGISTFVYVILQLSIVRYQSLYITFVQWIALYMSTSAILRFVDSQKHSEPRTIVENILSQSLYYISVGALMYWLLYLVFAQILDNISFYKLPLARSIDEFVCQDLSLGCRYLRLSDKVIRNEPFLHETPQPMVEGQAIYSGIHLNRRNMMLAKFGHGDLRFARISRSNLYGADFSHSDLQKSVISDTKLVRTSFNGANLRMSTIARSIEFILSTLA
jgi:hypothetical protein